MPPFGPGPPFWPGRPFYRQVDESEIRLDSVSLKLNRSNTLRLPFEVSLIIPRAEIRRRWYQGGQLIQEEEYNLSGITLVHSPRYPPRPGLFPGGRPGRPAFPEPGPTPAATPVTVPASPLTNPPEQLPASGSGETGGGGPAPPGKKVPPAWTLPPGEPVPPGRRAVPDGQFPSVQPDGPATPAKPARPVQPAQPDAPTRSRQPAPPAPEQNPGAEAVPPARPFIQPNSALPAGFASPPAPPAPPGSLSPQCQAPRIRIVTRRGKEQTEEKN